jgi:hypothetical protein
MARLADPFGYHARNYVPKPLLLHRPSGLHVRFFAPAFLQPSLGRPHANLAIELPGGVRITTDGTKKENNEAQTLALDPETLRAGWSDDTRTASFRHPVSPKSGCHWLAGALLRA